MPSSNSSATETNSDLSDNDLLEYEDLVSRCAKERRNLDISNGSARHARILIRKLFEVAKHDVRLITGRLTQLSDVDNVPIYSDEAVIDQAKSFLRHPGSALSIIAVEGAIDGGTNNSFLKAVTCDPERLGRVRLMVPDSSALAKLDVPHGMVADGEQYRFETGDDALNKKGPSAYTAVANFGNPKNGLKIYSYFGRLYRSLPKSALKEYGCGQAY